MTPTTPTTTTTTSPLLPLEIRLRTLESQLYGVPTSILRDNVASESRTGAGAGAGADAQSKGVVRRMRDAEETFQRLTGQSEGIKRLIESYEQYLPFLAPPSTNTDPTRTDPDAHPQTQDGKAISASDLLPDAVKLTMVLEAAGDIRGAERDLREIDLLKQRGVEGSGNLEELLPFRPVLIKSLKAAEDRSKEIHKARRDVASLLMRYNEVTSTTSDLFLDVHHQLGALEERVRSLERKKKKELAARF